MDNVFAFITKEFLEGILKERVNSFAIKNGSEAGVNYSTELILIKVSLEKCSKCLVIKIPPDHSLRQHFLDKLNLFPKEIFIYETILPEYRKLAEEANSEELCLTTAPFVAGRVPSQLHPDLAKEHPLATFFATEDIRPKGEFKRVDDYDGLDFDHCNILVRETAKFHALGWALKKRKNVSSLQDCYPLVEDFFFQEVHKEDLQAVLWSNYELVRKLVRAQFGEESGEFRAIDGFPNELGPLMSRFNNPRGLDEREIEKLLARHPDSDENFIEDSWTVACHGDLKTNNVLFKYDPKTLKPNGVALFDFQFYRECCPTIDLAFLLYSSVDHSFREKYLERLLQEYHDSFLHCCKLLKTEPFPKFSVGTLTRKFHRVKPFGLLAAIIVLPMVIQKHGESSLEKILDEDGKWSEFLTLATRADADLKVLSERFCGLAAELHQQGVI